MYTKTSATQSYLFLIAPLLLAAHGVIALTRLQPPTAVASTSSSIAAPILRFRGGALSVDDEGNLYSPRRTPLSRKVEISTFTNTDEVTDEKRNRRRRNPSLPSSRTADLASRCSVRGGTNAKNDHIGCLTVDEDGNLYSAQHLVPPPLRFRGGALLSVDSEGNLYSPRTATATPLSTKDETSETTKTTFIQRRRKSSSSSQSSSFRTADLASRTVRGRTTIKNNRFGRLSVDDEGNLYTPPKSPLAVRGGGFSRGGSLRVPNEELREELGITFGCFLFFASLLF